MNILSFLPSFEVFDRVHRLDVAGLISLRDRGLRLSSDWWDPAGGDDAEDIAWVNAEDLEAYGVNEVAIHVDGELTFADR